MKQALKPPPRPSISSLSQTLRFTRDPLSLLADARAECGDIFTLRLIGLGEWVFICSPDLATEMFRAPEDQLSASEATYRFLGFLLGADGVSSLSGRRHRARRSLSSSFLNGKGVLKYTSTIRRVVERAIKDWPDQEPFSMLPRAKMMTFEILFRVILGIEDRDRLERLAMLSGRFEKGLRSPLMQLKHLQWPLGRFSPWGKILWAREQLADELRSVITDRRQQDARKDENILNALISASEEDGRPLSDETIIDELMTMIAAGQETTTRFFCWTLLGLLSRPDIYGRARKEIQSVLQGQPIEGKHVSQFAYMDAVIQEGFRYQPLGAFNTLRLVKKPYKIGGHLLDEGIIVAQCVAEIGKRADLFEKPSGFHPENFLGKKFKGEWGPFGGGPRVCLGRGLALLNLKVTLVTIIQHTVLKLCQKDVRSMPGGFLMVPENGLLVELERRLSPDESPARNRDASVPMALAS